MESNKGGLTGWGGGVVSDSDFLCILSANGGSGLGRQRLPEGWRVSQAPSQEGRPSEMLSQGEVHVAPREDDWQRDPVWPAFAKPAKNALSEPGPWLWGLLWGRNIRNRRSISSFKERSYHLMISPATRWPSARPLGTGKISKGRDPPADPPGFSRPPPVTFPLTTDLPS